MNRTAERAENERAAPPEEATRPGTGFSVAPVHRYADTLGLIAEVHELRKFAAFAVDQGALHVITELFLHWKETRHGNAGRKSWAYRLSHVRTFATWLQGLEPDTEVPPLGLIPSDRKRPRPYIYTGEEIDRIVAGAAMLPSRRGLRGSVYATLFGLLAATGLRVGEALGLDDGDVDTDEALLHIRHAKNGRNRLIPVTPCTADRLGEYRSFRDRVLGPKDTQAFFVGESRRGICTHVAEYNFAQVSQEIGLREKKPPRQHGSGPRLHDMRHTFASRTLIDWYRAGLDPDREMYKLSTWLGHKHPRETYWYIEAVPEILQLATERAERTLAQGRQS